MTPVITIARLTLKEASRKKLMLALLGITLAVILLTNWGFWYLAHITEQTPTGLHPIQATELRAIVSQLLIAVMFMYSFVLALSAVFMTAPTIAGEIESGVVLALLTRPLSRAQLLLGKWLGLSLLITLYVAVACTLEFVGLNLITGYLPPRPLEFVAYLSGETIVILTLAMLISTRLPAMTGGVIALGGFGLAWMGGIAYNLGVILNSDAVRTTGVISRLLVPTDGLWRGAVFSLEPSAVIAATVSAGRGAASNPFFAQSGASLPYLGWVLAWVAGLLALSIYSFRTREI